MFEQICYYIAYIISISLQLTAGLLLIGNTDVSRNGIIKEYCLRHTAIAFEEEGTLADSTDLKNVAKSTWTNRIAFIYLAFGYLAGIFAEPLLSKKASFLIVVGLVAILTYFTFKVVKRKAECFESLHQDELPMTNGVMVCILDSTNTIGLK
ncbi:MAG: hypothetical protein E7441_10535 [Ruminococcaceae bacterium]|nr:hypothetical protein [Oscillospiraceae bacterium]